MYELAVAPAVHHVYRLLYAVAPTGTSRRRMDDTAAGRAYSLFAVCRLQNLITTCVMRGKSSCVVHAHTLVPQLAVLCCCVRLDGVWRYADKNTRAGK